jgi:hypothetical protein
MKPGWVRLSLHPTMRDEEILFITDAIRQVTKNAKKWGNEYSYDKRTNEFHKSGYTRKDYTAVSRWFDIY